VLEKMRAKGLAVRVNVVGFALASGSLKRSFEALAGAGGGRYFDAADGEGLAAVLGAAVRVAYVARAASGQVVGAGEIGGAPLALPAGRYRIEVMTTPPVVFDGVEVRDGEVRRLLLSAAR